jgi:SAM-dependent methyltransferase
MVKFEDIKNNKNIYLYAGDLPNDRRKNVPFIGLSLNNENQYNIRHNCINKMNLLDNSVDIYQSEDVFEHIEPKYMINIFNEIYRVLKPEGFFRLSMPDYKCNILKNRSLKDKDNNIYHDPGGGGNYDNINKKVINGGHVWFPTYEQVKELINLSKFNLEKVNFLHYYDENDIPVTNKIDYSKCFIMRTPDHDERVKNPYRPMSLVIDLYK